MAFCGSVAADRLFRGSGGGFPVARSMAAANFAGCAQARLITGLDDERAAAYPTAECGSSR